MPKVSSMTRSGSPVRVSTLMTSAPKSPSIDEAYGPDAIWVTSMIRTPCSGPVTESGPCASSGIDVVPARDTEHLTGDEACSVAGQEQDCVRDILRRSGAAQGRLGNHVVDVLGGIDPGEVWIPRESRRYGVNGHSERFRLDRCGSGEAHDAGLRRGVVRLAFVTRAPAVDRGHVHDCARALLAHVAPGLPSDAERRCEGDVHDVSPVLGRHFVQWRQLIETAVVHDDVEPAELADGVAHHFVDPCLVPNIERDSNHFLAGLRSDLLCGGRSASFVLVSQDNR